jgi:TRAP-type C4-dicarboxylate transport system permease small subunit
MTLAGIILFFVLMWGGFDYVTSQGAPDKLKTANAKITAGVIGFVLLVLSFLITRVIAYIFGLEQGLF